MPGSLDWKVNDMSVARMVTFVRSGLSTRVNCGVSAEVACTTLDRSTVTAVFGVVVRQTGSMFAAKVCGGRMVKYTVASVRFLPSETCSRTAARPSRIEPAWNTSSPSGRAETVASSVFSTLAPTRVSGSPSGSTKPPSAFMVYVAPCSTSVSSGCSLRVGVRFWSPAIVSVTVALEDCPRPSPIS